MCMLLHYLDSPESILLLEKLLSKFQVRPPSSLDICLCGLEPFFGAVDISHGSDSIALLTKIDPQKGLAFVSCLVFMNDASLPFTLETGICFVNIAIFVTCKGSGDSNMKGTQ